MFPMPTSIAPCYFFVIQWPDRQHDDRYGILLLSDADALAYANRIIRELKETTGFDDPELKMVVRNANDDVIHIIPF